MKLVELVKYFPLPVSVSPVIEASALAFHVELLPGVREGSLALALGWHRCKTCMSVTISLLVVSFSFGAFVVPRGAGGNT